jgi:V/A-type H+-transporting ATPase subunit C
MALLNMSFFDYGNTRLRARLSRMLSVRTLERLSESINIEAFLSALLKTPYKSVVEEAYATSHGLECAENALAMDLIKINEDLKKYYSEKSAEYIKLILDRSDLMNVMVILRGLIHQLTSEEIKRSLVLIGTIPNTILMTLAESLTVTVAINKMVSFRLPFALPLMQFLREKKAISSENINVFLRKWYYRDLFSRLDLKNENAKMFSEQIKTEIDCINLLMIMQWRFARNEKKLETNELIAEMILIGHLSVQNLEKVARNTTLKEMILSLQNYPYYSCLNQALIEYDHNKQISSFEKAFDAYQIKNQVRLIKSDPLGIGVPIGFLAHKNIEIRNLRWIAYGVHFGFESQTIKNGIQREL